MRKLGKRITALACAAVMVVSSLVTTTPMKVQAQNLDGFDNVVQQVAAEGCVLLKNENDVLPLAKGTRISIFGRSQRHYDKYRVFAGSGDGVKVNNDYAVSILDALMANGSGLVVNNDLVNTYKDWVNSNPYKTYEPGKSETWENRRLSQPEMPLSENQVTDARNKSDVAIVIISRLSGEDCDTSFDKGRYFLQDEEENMLKEVTKQFDKVCVLLNTTTIIDMSWVEKYGIESVMYVWNGGQSGGQAVADVITGKVNPSGKLADTIAKEATDYPTYDNYGDKNVAEYVEDIYVGYRYFETFAPDKVEYCFGYGLSYTDFKIETQDVEVDEENVKVVVSVTNEGDVAGKEVVQVYYGAPVGKLGNPAKELAAFAKTRELEPGETQNMALTFKISDMASYDDGGYTGHESAYVLEAGDYKFYVGNSVKDVELVHTYTIDKLIVVEQLTEAAAPYNDFQRMKAVEKNGKIVLEYEDVPTIQTNVEKRIQDNLPDQLNKKDNKTYKLIDVYNGNLTMEEFVAQMSNDDLASLLQGNSKNVDSYVGGSGSPFGGVVTKDGNGTTTLKKKYGIPVVTCVDGPAGAKIKDKTATLMPSGNVIACTWNLELALELYRMEGQELVLNQVDNLLGPGMNIHRDPRNGRNPEYYSEDPLLTGRLAAVAAKGIQESGATATGKHMAANNQDAERRTVDSRVSERALREIYMKPFEIYVKEGNGRAIMTAYNPINGCYAAGNYDINVTIVRNEWGYDGMIMTDWWADLSKQAWANGDMNKSGERIWVMIRGGGDIFMITNTDLYNSNGEPCEKISNLFKELNNGNVTRAEMQRSAVNVLNLIIESQAFARDNNINFDEYVDTFYEYGEDWFKVEQAELGKPLVTGITVGGRQVTSFNQSVTEYKVYAPADATEFPTVEATAEEGTTVTVEQATADTRVAIVKAKEQQATKRYRIVFTDAEGVKPVLENPVYASVSDIKVDGETVDGFASDVNEYSVAVSSLDSEPEITWTAPEGVTVTKTYDSTNHTAKLLCVSEDQAISYTIKFGIAPQSDEFEGTELNKFWTVEQENGDTLKLADGHLTIGAEYGSIWQGQDHLKNRVFQSAYGDWESVTKIDIPKLPSKNYQAFGVIAMEDYNNYVYVKMEYCSDQKVLIALCHEKDGSISTVESLTDEQISEFTDAMYVKLTKLGNTYLAAVSPDGENYIRFLTPVVGEYENPKFMFVNGNGDQNLDEILEAKYDYVHFETENIGDTVKIGEDTKLNLGEVAPSATDGLSKSAASKDGGYYLAGKEEGDISYNIEVEKTGYYDVYGTYSLDTNETQQLRMAVSVDGDGFGDQFGGDTGGDENWEELSFGNIRLTAGKHTVKVHFYNTMNANYLQFKRTETLEDTELKTAVESAQQKDVSAFPEELQTAYKNALMVAEKALEEAKTQDEIDAALKVLADAEEALKVEKEITSIKAEKDSLTLKVKDTAKIKVTVEPEDYTEVLEWKSENPDIATVTEDGTVTGVSAGTTNIVISCASGAEAKVAVTVEEESTDKPSDPDTTEPSTPSEPDTTEPTKPSEPDATEPSTPSEPDATEPSTPSQPSTPSEPSTPSQPSTPSEPSTPSQPSTPSEPTTPSQPTVPSQPTTPSQPTNPDKVTQTESELMAQLGVSAAVAKEISALAKQYKVSDDTLLVTGKVVTAIKNEKDVAGSTFGLLQAKATKQTKNSIKLKWTKVKGADGYLVYGNKCGKSYKLLKDVTGGAKTTYTQKKLTKGTYYKYIVVAYKKVDNAKMTLAASKTIHSVTKGGKAGVAKNVTVKATNVKLNVGKTAKIVAKEVKADKPIKRHRSICYESTNTAVATVNKRGTITAKKKGNCYVYVYAQNGVCKRVKVTVK